MEYVHRCIVCDWQRAADSPAVTSPRCENCGCALESVHVSDVEALQAVSAGIELPESLRAGFLRLAAFTGAALLFLAAARTGYTAGGPAIAVTAFGVAGLIVVMAMTAERA